MSSVSPPFRGLAVAMGLMAVAIVLVLACYGAAMLLAESAAPQSYCDKCPAHYTCGIERGCL